MTQRYSLRFETGERRGDRIPITGPVFSIGRAQDNSLTIQESSVSSHHAELVLDENGALLRDLGSTNGTRVENERVLELRLRAGAKISLGNVGLSFHDAETREAVVRRAPSEVPLVAGRSDLEVSDEKLARARKGSLTGLVLMVLAVATSGAAWWYFRQGGQRPGERLSPVQPVSGNLLADGYSFEGESPPWRAREGLEANFRRAPRARASGQMGLSVDLDAGETAVHESQIVIARPGKALGALAELRAPGDVLARIGLQFRSAREDEGRPAPMIVWSEASRDVSGFEQVRVAATVPDGYDRARVLVLASADAEGQGGRVDVDDVSLVTATGSGAPTNTMDEYRLFLLGAPPVVASVFKVDHVVLSGLRVRGAEGLGRGVRTLAVAEEPNGLRVTHDAQGAAILFLHAEPGGLEGGMATMGAGGYTPHSVDFERAGVTDLLLGTGGDLVRLAFSAPVELRGRSRGRGFRLTASMPAGCDFLLQLRFRAERAEAGNLAAAADAAERRGDLGVCLAKWQELLDRYPFEPRAVARAADTRARLIQAGSKEVTAMAGEVERARFFRLLDLFRKVRADASGLAARYGGSEVESGALDLVAAIDVELALLEAEIDRHDVQRLESILATLEAQEASGLVAEVREYLASRYGGSR